MILNTNNFYKHMFFFLIFVDRDKNHEVACKMAEGLAEERINPLSVNDVSRPPKFPVQNSVLTPVAHFKLGTFPRASSTNYTKKKNILVLK